MFSRRFLALSSRRVRSLRRRWHGPPRSCAQGREPLARPSRTNRSVWCILFPFGTLGVIVLNIGVVSSSPTADAQTFQQATEVTAPSNALSGSGGLLDSISCPSAGNCVAVDSCQNNSDAFQETEATESGGTWGQAATVTSPSNAASNPGADLTGVSCTSPGNCVAVGEYIDVSGNGQAMEATESGGTWGQTAKVTSPSNAASNPGADLTGVSCTSPGNCVAVGEYSDVSGNGQAMEAAESGGPGARRPR